MLDAQKNDMSFEQSIVPYFTSSNEDASDMSDFAKLLVAGAKERGLALTGEGGLLTDLTRQVLQTALEVEMQEHLGYERGDRTKPRVENYRNGYSEKTLKTDIGEVQIQIPRDREGSFEPATVPKHKRRIDGLDEAVLSLYSKGMTTTDICDFLSETYGTKLSKDTISKITDGVVEEMSAWRTRPLDSVYPVIIIDAIVIKVRDGSVANRPVYVVLGITTEGLRDVLGLWVGPTGGEGAKQWMGMLTDLKNRGVQDVLIACCDGLKGLPEALSAIWPEVTVQTCVVHLIRNSLRHVKRKEMKEAASDLRRIYTAPNEEAALRALDEVEGIWAERYPAMIASWRRAWTEFCPFLSFPPEIRKIIYTTNAVESLNARYRKAVRKRGHFPTELSALKVLYLATIRRVKNQTNPISKIIEWNQVFNTLSLVYGERLERR
ncbi:MAG: IS256 family transposase [Eggerthellaceae bacterium]|nr:IS256 family transposase [Eggerthellaceae bacterium]